MNGAIPFVALYVAKVLPLTVARARMPVVAGTSVGAVEKSSRFVAVPKLLPWKETLVSEPRPKLAKVSETVPAPFGFRVMMAPVRLMVSAPLLVSDELAALPL